MKFIVTFKNPDALDDSITQAVWNGSLTHDKIEKAKKVCRKFFEYGAYVNVEVDIEKGTATVIRID